VKRREFISLLGGAVAWPLTARAQQGEQMRRIGVLKNLGSDDAESIFSAATRQLGVARQWTFRRLVAMRLGRRKGVFLPRELQSITRVAAIDQMWRNHRAAVQRALMSRLVSASTGVRPPGSRWIPSSGR
jgi:hypothetical protein